VNQNKNIRLHLNSRKRYTASKPKLDKLLFTLLYEFEEVNAENCMLKGICSELEKDMILLERTNKN